MNRWSSSCWVLMLLSCIIAIIFLPSAGADQRRSQATSSHHLTFRRQGNAAQRRKAQESGSGFSFELPLLRNLGLAAPRASGAPAPSLKDLNGGGVVTPAILSTFASVGTKSMQIAQRLSAKAQPLVKESASQWRRTVDTQIVPRVKAGLDAVSQSAVHGVDRLAVALMGQKAKEETSQALGTLVTAITGSNDGTPDTDQQQEASGEQDKQQHQSPQHRHHHHHPSPVVELPNQTDTFQYINYPDTLHWVTLAGSPDFHHQPSSERVPRHEEKAAQPEPPVQEVHSSSRNQSVEQALYVLGRNILGRNVTDRLLPVAKKFATGLNQIGQGISTLSETLPPLPSVEFDGASLRIAPTHHIDDTPKKVRNTDSSRQESTSSSSTESPRCTTPDGGQGRCMDIQNCPFLITNLETLRKSICFKSLFIPGVCCPDKGVTLIDFGGSTTESNEIQAVVDEEDEDDEQIFIQPQGTTSSPNPNLPVRLPPPTPPPAPVVVVDEADFVPGNTKRECGVAKVPQSRIVGGNITFEGEYPWMVALYLHGNGRSEYWCGGALVSPWHVLTAAHCTKDAKKRPFQANQFTAKVGEWDLKDDDSYSREIRVASITAHPDFRANGFYNDLAVMKLQNAVQFNEHIQPICLPSGHIMSRDLTGTFPVVLGWGATQYGGKEVGHLRGVALPVWTNEDCDKAYFQPITEVFLCAGFADGGRDACQGDSGGPLMFYDEKNHQWTLIGIVSFGNRCAEVGYPGVYTRLTHFMPWIVANMA